MNSAAQLRRLGLFDARVPRYTSYPSANHFSDTIGPSHMSDWIEAIEPGSGLSLYAHIPFCRRLCWFCACRTQGTATAAPVNGYLDVLERELDMVAGKLPAGVTLSRLHWGGGTPTLLEADRITRLAHRIAQIAPFAEGAEFSVEIDPNEIDDARLDALAAAGVNRASIGVQDFDADIQATIGRPQTYAATKWVVDGLRDRGIGSLNIDILYGLPHQTVTRISDSVQKVLSLAPDRVALYGYAHVPWMARRQSLIPTEALPAPEARLKLFETARQLFLWDGFEEIGIDHFARPDDGLAKAYAAGRLRRNFQGYTDDPARVLLGVGASAISQFPQGYAQNNASTSGYHGAIVGGQMATTRGHVLTEEDRIRAALISSIMCDFKVDFGRMSKQLGVPASSLSARFDGIQEAFPSLLSRTADEICLLPEARPLTRMIARYVDEYAVVEQQTHSSAI